MPIIISDRTVSKELRRKIKEISGEDVGKCFQCGTCSGSCPMTDHMTSLPRRAMALAHLSQEEALLNADTPRVCASCHMCTVRCPRGIDIARVMEAMRQVILRKNVNHVELCKLPQEDIKDAPTIAMVAGMRKMTS